MSYVTFKQVMKSKQKVDDGDYHWDGEYGCTEEKTRRRERGQKKSFRQHKNTKMI